jgi:hypothetical protein
LKSIVLRRDRLAWLKSQRAQAGEKPVHSLKHQPPFDIGVAFVGGIKLQNRNVFARAPTSGATIRQANYGHGLRITRVHFDALLHSRSLAAS